jgi:hypothetical protein
MSKTAGGPYSVIARNVSGASYTAIALTNHTVYYFVVSGVDSMGEGPNSAEAHAQPNRIPGLAGGLTATPGDGQVKLTWIAASYADTYNVKMSKTAGGPYSVIAHGVTGTTYAAIALANKTLYYFVVSGSDSMGEGPNSAEAHARPAPAGSG